MFLWARSTVNTEIVRLDMLCGYPYSNIKFTFYVYEFSGGVYCSFSRLFTKQMLNLFVTV